MRQTNEMNGMKKYMSAADNTDMDRESMKQIAEAFGNVLESLFGDDVPVVMVECKPADEGSVAAEHLLNILKQHLSESDEDQNAPDNRTVDDQEAAEDHAEDVKHTISFEGDGEEVFTKMMGDLISFADMVERLELILMAVSCGKMCPVRGMKAAGLMVKEVSEVMEKWLEYSRPEA